MKFNMYAIYDKVSGSYAMPFSFRSTGRDVHGAAVRSYRRLYADPNSYLSTNPQDFELYLIGDFDDETGQLIGRIELISTSEDTHAEV